MNIMAIIAAFFGGIFGATIGGVGSFVLFGLMGIIGTAIQLAGGSDLFLNEVAFNPLFSPATAFTGGVAAAAYLNRKTRKMTTVERREVTGLTAPLYHFKQLDVLAVGGIFGVIGYLISTTLANLGLPGDTVAWAFGITGIVSRYAFGGIGILSPSMKDGFKWDLKKMGFDTVWAFGLGFLLSTILETIGAEYYTLGFFIGAFLMVFQYFPIDFPMIHHVSLVAGAAFVVFGNAWMGGLFAVLAVLVGEVLLQLINTEVDAHIDFPALVIGLFSTLLFGLF